MTASTVPALLRRLVESDSARPLITFYDDRTGERVELSVLSFENWVAKTANLLVDGECAEPGELLSLRLPTHWQGAVWLCAAWSAGLVTAFDDATSPVADHAITDGDLGGYAREVLTYGDQFTAPAAVSANSPALLTADGAWTHSDVLAHGTQVASSAALGAAPRLFTDHNPCSLEGVGPALLAPLMTGGSLVLVANRDPEQDSARTAQERVTARILSASAAED